MKFIDTHAHLYLDEFNMDRDVMIQRALTSEVGKIVLPNINLESLSSVIELSRSYPENCFASIGLHPCDVKTDYKDILYELSLRFNSTKFIAIGETGTDAYWDTTYWNQQLDAFSRQLDWSKEHLLPIIIHSRETLSQNIEIVRKQQDGRLSGVFHCFTGTLEQAKEIIDLGFYLGIGGVLTYKNSNLKEVLKSLDSRHLVLETDAPYLSPVPHRGKRNESAFIPIIATHLAELYQTAPEEIAHQTTLNATTLFNFK
jgi:TatD DNase family protein